MSVKRSALHAVTLLLCLLTIAPVAGCAEPESPNIVFLFTDDQRFDALNAVDSVMHTPNLDRLVQRGVRFANAFATLSICSPSRAAVMSGQYGSVNGVTTLGQRLSDASPKLPALLREAGYRTGMMGKWHLGNKPQSIGFDEAIYFMSNGTYYNRKIIRDGEPQTAPGYIDDYMADRSVEFIERAARDSKPFFLWFCTQLPHMDHRHDWPAQPQYLDLYDPAKLCVPPTWDDDLSTKPPYLKNARSRTQALSYGYDKKPNIQRHRQRYQAAISQADEAIGRVIDAIDRLKLTERTVFIVMGDNGWMIGDHGFTSKVLAYEPSMRVPMIITAPGIKPGVDEHLVLNIDLTPTMLDFAGVSAPDLMHGKSLMPLLRGNSAGWRDAFVYEAPTPCLGSHPIYAARNQRWKLIQTYDPKQPDRITYRELYDLENDPDEMNNRADDPDASAIVKELAARIAAHRKTYPTSTP
ncbi:sulfatase-like hydrolase/transferase [Planctomycetales bacterium ZRK34]|nr:sulfatase-like hydrolase/transferase [Planctomycetales bacterium ZRK34]